MKIKVVENVEKYIEYLQILAQGDVSLNTPVSNSEFEDDRELGDTIESPAPSPEEEMLRSSDRQILLEAIDSLDDARQSIVIKYRYGFIDGVPRTLDEIGKRFGVTRERIRQVEARALRSLKKKLLQRGITGDE